MTARVGHAVNAGKVVSYKYLACRGWASLFYHVTVGFELIMALAAVCKSSL